MNFRNTILAVVLMLWAVDVSHAQVVVEGQWKPPFVPFALSVDTEEGISVHVANEVSTPFGTFSGSIQDANPKALNTYFLVRMEGRQKLYSIGTRGTLRLKTKGQHEIELGTHDGYPNLITVDVQSDSGRVDLEFVPDCRDGDVARIRQTVQDLVVKTNGTIVLDNVGDDDVDFSVKDVKKLLVADFPKDERLKLAILFDFDNKPWFKSFCCEGQNRLEAMWLAECLRSTGTVSRRLVVEKEFGKGLRIIP